ncbi:hypothetical protein GOBAR_AA14652 [Gossypium barbadense]|uniref:Uncharacterized protein n=1 Tax=Gossypium barbadense TaxID=3634 RepID=A0A2P5XRS2_GOSBA|nr:hypothetical protein GOBAR_AA14652 [Gossypium barbadense]
MDGLSVGLEHRQPTKLVQARSSQCSGPHLKVGPEVSEKVPPDFLVGTRGRGVNFSRWDMRMTLLLFASSWWEQQYSYHVMMTLQIQQRNHGINKIFEGDREKRVNKRKRKELRHRNRCCRRRTGVGGRACGVAAAMVRPWFLGTGMLNACVVLACSPTAMSYGRGDLSLPVLENFYPVFARPKARPCAWPCGI